MDENTIHSESKELIQARKLIDVSRLDEADQIIKTFEEKGGHTLYDMVLCHLLKCELLGERGLHEDIIKLAEETYKESLKLGKNLVSVDILLEKAYALLCLGETDKAHDIIKQGEILLNTLTQELPAEYKQRKAYIALQKGWVYDQKLDTEKALKQFELSLSLREELGAKRDIAWSLYGMANVFMNRKGDFDRALTYLERGIVFAEESGNKLCIGGILYSMAMLHSLKGELDRAIMLFEQSLTFYIKLDNKFMKARILNSLGACFALKGELNRSIKFYEHSLELLMEFNNELIIAMVFNSLALSHKMKGELNRALECIEQSMPLSREFGILNVFNHHYLIQILIDMGEFERAQNYLLDFEQLNSQFKDKKVNSMYLLDKASLLKTSSRALNRGKAEEILKQLLEDGGLDYETNIEVLLNLCELLITELQITNEVEVLEELKPLITQLLDLSEKSHSFWVLGETYLLQAKLSLISLNLEEARKLLTKGQEITEKYGLSLLARKISNEHDILLEQLDSWENLKEINAPLTERMNLAGINEQVEKMITKRVSVPEKVKADLPIVLMIIQQNGNPTLIKHFTSDKVIDEAYLGEFFASFNKYCSQIFSKTFDRVKLGQYKVLINTLNGFSVCYLFHGQTYSAQQKIKFFSEVLIKDNQIMAVLKNANNSEKTIELSDNPLLEELITKSFLSDPKLFRMPFEAYIGDEAFVFASYAHADKLDVYPILDYLNNMNIKIWYDEGIPVSENWKRSIAFNLERCKTFLVFVSPQILNSEYVKKEISFALKKNKPFFAVYLKETILPTDLEFEMADIQAMMKFLMPKKEFYSKLKILLTDSLKN
ncbi:MAG: tetratricopeptide repeat protein [Promethearchaeota archaeon]